MLGTLYVSLEIVFVEERVEGGMLHAGMGQNFIRQNQIGRQLITSPFENLKPKFGKITYYDFHYGRRFYKEKRIIS